jgi:hypothetical protein
MKTAAHKLHLLLITVLFYGVSFGQNNNGQTGPFAPYDNKLKDGNPDNNNGLGNNSAPTTTNVPFDGGLSVVLAAGAGLAIKKARDKRKAANAKL